MHACMHGPIEPHPYAKAPDTNNSESVRLWSAGMRPEPKVRNARENELPWPAERRISDAHRKPSSSCTGCARISGDAIGGHLNRNGLHKLHGDAEHATSGHPHAREMSSCVGTFRAQRERLVTRSPCHPRAPLPKTNHDHITSRRPKRLQALPSSPMPPWHNRALNNWVCAGGQTHSCFAPRIARGSCTAGL